MKIVDDTKTTFEIEDRGDYMRFALHPNEMRFRTSGINKMTKKQAVKLAKKICEFYEVAVIPKKMQSYLSVGLKPVGDGFIPDNGVVAYINGVPDPRWKASVVNGKKVKYDGKKYKLKKNVSHESKVHKRGKK